jgi:hypothetical protein
MKKIFIAIIVILVFLVATSVQSLAGHKHKDQDPPEGNEIYGCVKMHKKHGKLRIVSDPSQCKGNETLIYFDLVGGDGGGGVPDELYERIEDLENNAMIKRFTDMGNGTIRDNESGLIWLKDASCSTLAGVNTTGRANWDTATGAANTLAHTDPVTCGLTDTSSSGDWRLPTNAEWDAFLSHVYDSLALANTVGTRQWSEGDAFVDVFARPYWSSTPTYDPFGVLLPGRHGTADLATGDIISNGDDVENFVWPVRDP